MSKKKLYYVVGIRTRRRRFLWSTRTPSADQKKKEIPTHFLVKVERKKEIERERERNLLSMMMAAIRRKIFFLPLWGNTQAPLMPYYVYMCWYSGIST